MATSVRRVLSPLLLALMTLMVFPAAAQDSTPEEVSFPSIAPFQASRFWDVMRRGEGGSVDLDALVQQLTTIYDIKASSSEVAAKYGPEPHKGEPEALLKDMPKIAVRARWSATPYALQELFALHDVPRWDDQQLARAESAAAILTGLPRAPRLGFGRANAEKRRRAIRSAAKWYETQLAIPEHFASMIFTQDDGPFVGLKHKRRKLLPSVASVKLGEDLVLHLGRDKKSEEPFVLQCTRGKKLLWSRTVSDSPYQTVRDVTLSEKQPTPLDDLGWKVHMSVKWRKGTEYTHVYIDAEGQLICYFMSW